MEDVWLQRSKRAGVTLRHAGGQHGAQGPPDFFPTYHLFCLTRGAIWLLTWFGDYDRDCHRRRIVSHESSTMIISTLMAEIKYDVCGKGEKEEMREAGRQTDKEKREGNNNNNKNIYINNKEEKMREKKSCGLCVTCVCFVCIYVFAVFFLPS